MQPQVDVMPHTAGHSLSDTTSDLSPKAERSSLISRNVTIGNHRTSIRLEPDMWVGLRDICRREHVTLHDIATLVSARKANNTSLTAAIRVFIMAYFRSATTEEGHSRAGHGPGGSFMAALVSKNLAGQERQKEDGSTIVKLRLAGIR